MTTAALSRAQPTPASIALLTVGYLFGGFLVGIGLGFAIGTPGHGAFQMVRNIVAGILAVTGMSVAAARWGRAIALRTNAPDVRRATLAGALSFGPAALLVGLALTGAEVAIVGQGRGPKVPIHVLYGFLFVPGSFVIASVSALILGVGLRRRGGELVRLALTTGVAACAAYLVIYLLMDAAGWRVGGPDAAKRATMLVVTGLGSLGAAFAGGAAMGSVLLRPAPRRPNQ
jgi:hypothetical protein